MKRVLLGFGLLVLVLLLALGVFVATFNLDRYRPQLVAQLEQTLGRGVRLGSISFSWEDGLALRVDDLAILADVEGAPPILEVESAKAIVDLAPFLQREIHVASVVLTRPTIRLARDVEGHMELPVPAAVNPPQTIDPGAAQELDDAEAQPLYPSISPRFVLRAGVCPGQTPRWICRMGFSWSTFPGR